MYIQRPNNHEEEVYDILISYNIERNHELLRRITYPITLHDIRLILDSNSRTSILIGRRLYLQSGLIDINSII